MENPNTKFSFKGHKENDAIIYCQEFKKYLCNKCLNYHSGLFEDHELIHLNKESKDIFTVNARNEPVTFFLMRILLYNYITKNNRKMKGS